MLPTVSDLRSNKKKKPGIERSGPTPTALHRAGWPGGSGTGGAPAAAVERLCCWTASHYIRMLAHICRIRMCADSRCPSYLAVSGLLAGGCWERGTSGTSLVSCSRGGLAGRTCYCRWLWRLSCWNASHTESRYIRTFARVFIYVVSECAPTRDVRYGPCYFADVAVSGLDWLRAGLRRLGKDVLELPHQP